MKVFIISHETRKGGAGSLDNQVFSNFLSAYTKVDDYVNEHYNPSYIENFWVSNSEFSGEEDYIEILEKEIK